MRSLPRRHSRFACTAIRSARACAILDRFASIDPGIGEVATLRTIAATVAYLLQIAFWLTVSLGALALVLTLSGLFSVLSYWSSSAPGR